MENVIDLTAYLPHSDWSEKTPKRRHFTTRQIVDSAVGVIEGLVTLGIGLCFTAGIILFLGLLL